MRLQDESRFRVQVSEETRILSSYFSIGMRVKSLSSQVESKGFIL